MRGWKAQRPAILTAGAVCAIVGAAYNNIGLLLQILGDARFIAT